MKLIAPDYYDRFACIAGSCRHSCCVGWEIDIDDESLETYRSLPGALGGRLRAHIEEDAQGAHFRLVEGERCPFLNRDGLCELILELGEDSLCQICADHPRFRNYIYDREETGLGLCCEAAGALILGCRHMVQLQQIGDDLTDDVPDPDEAELIDLRDGLIAMAQNRSLPVERRLEGILNRLELEGSGFEPGAWAPYLLGLERMDPRWTQRLEQLMHTAPLPAQPCDAALELPLEQLLVYLLYRHLAPAAMDGELRARLALCALIWHVLRALCRIDAGTAAEYPLEAMAETCRLYSAEIEYSDENIGALLDELHRRLPGL